MRAWVDGCPTCRSPISAHNEEAARAHYNRWLVRMSDPVPMPTLVESDQQPDLVGEYDPIANLIYHKARS